MTVVLNTRSEEIGDWAIEQYRRWHQKVMAPGTVAQSPPSPTEENAEPEDPGAA